MNLLETLERIPKSNKVIVLQPTHDDEETQDNEAKDIANGKHDDVRRKWAGICGTVAESAWRVDLSWGPQQWLKSVAVAVANSSGAKLAVSWDVGRGITEWDTWSDEMTRRVEQVVDRLALMRHLSGDLIGHIINNHEHDDVTPKNHETVTRFLRACIGAMRAAFPQAEVMVYDEGRMLLQGLPDITREIYPPYLPVRERLGDVRCVSRYPRSQQLFQLLCEQCRVDVGDNRPLYPWLWWVASNHFAREFDSDAWWHGRERIDWDEPELVRQMELRGNFMRVSDDIKGCVIHNPQILNPMHAAALAALVRGFNG